MISLSLEPYLPLLKKKEIEGRLKVFDPVRRKYIILGPEEMVRQLFIQYLVIKKGFSLKRIQVERKIDVNKQAKRFDMVIFDHQGKINVLVEIKRTHHFLNQEILDQISVYNLSLKADYLMITNGIYCKVYKMDYQRKAFHEMDDIPTPESIG